MDNVHRRRKTDRYERPADDHDLLTQLWTMFVHFSSEQDERHGQNTALIDMLRKEIAEHRASQNFRVDGLESAFNAKIEHVRQDLQDIRDRSLKQVGALELIKIALTTAVSSAAVLTLLLKLTGAI